MARKYPLSEWSTTAMMLGIAACIFITPRTIEMGSFRFMQEIGIGPSSAFLIFASAGILRIIALYANGRWPHGTTARVVSGSVGAFMWFQMAWALMLLTRETGTLSVGIPVYLCLTVSEVISCYRVAFDSHRPAGTAHHARRYSGPA